MKPVAYLVKCPEGDYLIWAKQLGVLELDLELEAIPLYDIPEGFCLAPDRRHQEEILGDYGMEGGEMVQKVSYQPDRRYRGDRRKE